MSPEQARGREVGPASDVFSLGSVLVFALTGRSPFGAGHPDAVIYRVVHDEPDLTGLPADLTDLIASCLAKNPADRPALAGILDRLAASTRAATHWLPPDITSMITVRDTAAHGETADSGATLAVIATDERTPVRAREKTTLGKYTLVALPWLPGETAGMRKTTVIRWRRLVGDEVAVDEPLLEVSSARGDTVITSPVGGILYATHRRAGQPARIGSVIAGIGAPGATVPSPPLPRPVRITALSLTLLLVASVIMGLVSVESPLFMDDVHQAQAGDCVAREFPIRGKELDVDHAKWFTMPCALMEVRNGLGTKKNSTAYFKVLNRDSGGECFQGVENWYQRGYYEHAWADMVLCMRRL